MIRKLAIKGIKYVEIDLGKDGVFLFLKSEYENAIKREKKYTEGRYF